MLYIADKVNTYYHETMSKIDHINEIQTEDALLDSGKVQVSSNDLQRDDFSSSLLINREWSSGRDLAASLQSNTVLNDIPLEQRIEDEGLARLFIEMRISRSRPTTSSGKSGDQL